MWIGKLYDGVLRVLTPVGPRYIRLSFSQRIYLLWMFRHFDMLPQQVLNSRQRKLIDSLCAQRNSAVRLSPTELEATPLVGTVERRPPILVDESPRRKPNARAAKAGALAGGLQQRS